MMRRPTIAIQRKRAISRISTLDARPISATDKTRPATSTQKCWRAAPATESTLSSDIEASATARRNTAFGSVTSGPPATEVAFERIRHSR